MIDSHAHIMFDSFDVDRDDVIARTREAGVQGWLEIGTDIGSSRRAVALAQQHAFVWAAVGVHPDDITDLSEASWQELEKLLEKDRVVAVGEVGFDFYREGTLVEQRPVVERFVALALSRDLPVVWHVRSGDEEDAHEALLDYLEALPRDQIPSGVIHTYSGDEQQAERYLALGLYLSFSGVVTFKNAGAAATVAQTVSLERMLIETDCPFLAPEPYRGKRNEPAYVRYVAERIAQLRGLDIDEVIEQTVANAKNLFGL